MNPISEIVQRADRFQQRTPWLAFPVAVWKKFGDDRAGNLAALIAYNGFAAVFPLLLVLVTLLDITMKNIRYQAAGFRSLSASRPPSSARLASPTRCRTR